MELTDAQIDRYSRQIVLGEIGGRGQARLLRSRVLVAGAPPWMGAALAYLLAAGVGRTTWQVPPAAADGARGRAAALAALNPDATLTVTETATVGGIDAQVFVDARGSRRAAVDLARAARERRVPVLVPVLRPTGLWLGVFRTDRPDEACPACAGCEPPEPLAVGAAAPAAVLAAGSLVALEVARVLLDLPPRDAAVLQYDVEGLTMERRTPERDRACPLHETDGWRPSP